MIKRSMGSALVLIVLTGCSQEAATEREVEANKEILQSGDIANEEPSPSIDDIQVEEELLADLLPMSTEEDNSHLDKLEKYADLGPSVYPIKFDKQGRIKSCLVVGSSRISKVLGNTTGLQIAQKRAALSANAEFVEWLKNNVEVYAGSDDETTLFLEGSEGNDEDARRESGKRLEKDTETINSVARNLIRGLELVHKKVTGGEDNDLRLVYGWSAETADAVRQIDEDQNSVDNGKGRGGSEAKSGRSDKKTIKDKSTTSPNAKRFFE